MVTILSSSVLLAPLAAADAVDNLRNAVVAARAGSSCGALGPSPVVEHVAAVINKSFNDWLDHTATYAPIEDPLPGLKELGYRGSKGVYFGGASTKSEAESIRAVLLEGFDKIPDCSYADMGVSMLKNEGTGFYLTAVVLAGP
jgi:hypothetical protein